MVRRPPSASSIRSQLNREMKKAVRKAEREANRELDSMQRKLKRDVDAENRRAQRRLANQAGRSRPLSYTVTERAYLDEVRHVVEQDEVEVERERDLFLCHAWDDRQHAALELVEALAELGVDVWFSEKDVALGSSLPRQLDRGIRLSRVGVVLVTPAMMMALRRGGFADQELGALLATGRVIPVLHDVTHKELEGESPLLAARAGISTDGSSLREVAEKIADSVL